MRVIVRDMGNRKYLGFIFSLLFAGVLLSGCTNSLGGEKGTISFVSSPNGAEVYLDQHYQGSTPVTLSGVEPGAHTLEYRLAGYTPYSAAISVPEGPSQYFASLFPLSDVPTTSPTRGGDQVTPPTPSVTIQVGKDPMIVGDSVIFSGTGPSSSNVLLILYGPGFYARGVILKDPKVNSAGLWSYTWNPGTSVRSGIYTIVVSDATNTTSARASFNIIGGGEITVTPSNHALAKGDTVRFSGRCSTGAPSVRLVLYGPDRFSVGSELGTVSVLGDKTWSFKYTLDPSMPTGTYTINVYDVPKTTVGTAQFTVGFASSS